MPQENASSTLRRLPARAAARGKHLVAEALRARFADGRVPVRTLLGTPGDDGMPIVLCTWARIDALPRTLEELAAQQDAPPIDLWIWNNRRSEHARLVELVRGARATGALRSVSAVRSPFNLGSIARFYLARRLWQQGRRGHFMVIDDDFVLPTDLVSVAVANAVEGGAAGFWAWTLGADYFDRTRAEPGDRVDHLGPAGTIVDLALVSDAAFFHDVPRDDWFMDDVWFTHWALAHGMPLERLPIDVPMLADDHSLHPHQIYAKLDFHQRMRALRG